MLNDFCGIGLGSKKSNVFCGKGLGSGLCWNVFCGNGLGMPAAAPRSAAAASGGRAGSGFEGEARSDGFVLGGEDKEARFVCFGAKCSAARA